MADTDALRPYTPASQPTIAGYDRKFIQTELQKLQQAITLLIDVMKKLERRIASGGL